MEAIIQALLVGSYLQQAGSQVCKRSRTQGEPLLGRGRTPGHRQRRVVPKEGKLAAKNSMVGTDAAGARGVVEQELD
jgi:hypothetical protein